jgi:ecdysteroid 2-hydroxylase
LSQNLNIIDAFRLHLTMDGYHRRYGPVVHVKLGQIDAVFLSSADNMRSIFSHEGKHPKHIIPPAWLYFNQKHNIERGLLFM